MDDDARDELIADLVESIDGRSAFDGAELAAALVTRCWPGGVDRSDPVAIEWVRRWGPARWDLEPLDCSCDQGRCAVCN